MVKYHKFRLWFYPEEKYCALVVVFYRALVFAEFLEISLQFIHIPLLQRGGVAWGLWDPSSQAPFESHTISVEDACSLCELVSKYILHVLLFFPVAKRWSFSSPLGIHSMMLVILFIFIQRFFNRSDAVIVSPVPPCCI